MTILSFFFRRTTAGWVNVNANNNNIWASSKALLGFRCPRYFDARTLQMSASASTSAIGYPMLENKNLVSIQDCLDAYQQKTGGIVFVDASWYHRDGRNGRKEFEEGPRIVGSKHVDMDDISAQKDLFPENNRKGLPRMIPPKKLFALAMDTLGIQNSDHVVIYGKDGCIFTPRTWFLFRELGHDSEKIHLMQGSLEEWMNAGGPIETEPCTVPRAKDILERSNGASATSYQARDATNVVTMQQVLKTLSLSATNNTEEDKYILLDPRGTSFASGHIPGARNIPYALLVDPTNSLRLKPKDELLDIFENAGVDVMTDKQILCSCGSGVSVCHLVLALEECGRDVKSNSNTVIYDGSWTEWGVDPDTPKSSDD